MATVRTATFTARDKFNAGAATPLKKMVNQTINVIGVCVAEKADGEMAGYIKADNGEIYATISNSVMDQLIDLAEMLTEEEVITVRVLEKLSNAGRTYYMLNIE